MSFVQPILTLLALPLELLGRAAAMFSPPMAATLHSAAWVLAGNPQTAMMALQTVKKTLGTEAMLAQAERWMARRPQAAIAAIAGLTTLNRGDLPGARQWHDRARLAGRDDSGIDDLLEYLVTLADDPSQATQLAREFSTRRDLGPGLVRLIKEELLWDDLFAGRHDDARRGAEHLLAIQKDLPASAAMWALETRRGRPAAAQKHLRDGMEFPRETWLYWQCLASTALDSRSQTQLLLDELRAVNESAAAAAHDAIFHRTARLCH